MITLVVVSLDNITLRLESNDPQASSYLLAMGVISNEVMEREREELVKVYADVLSFGIGKSETGIGTNGLINIRHIPIAEADNPN
jgi:hypothetical protein